MLNEAVRVIGRLLLFNIHDRNQEGSLIGVQSGVGCVLPATGIDDQLPGPLAERFWI